MTRTFVALLLLATPAFAQTNHFDLGVSGGTLGASLSASYRPTSTFGLRATVNRGSHTRNFTESDVNYDATLKLDSVAGMLDLYPSGRAFRISAGVLSNRNRVEGRTTERNVVTINGTNYPSALVGYLTAQATARRTAPIATIGFAPSGRRWGLTFDVGAVYQGSPRIAVQAHPTIPELVPAKFYADLEAERAKTEQDWAKYKWYPVAQLGITFGF